MYNAVKLFKYGGYMIVIDSSVLISLAKIDSLLVLNNFVGTLYCPKEVYEEVIGIGVINGYPDAFLIQKEVFQPMIIQIKEIVNKYKIKGISDVDSSVLLLARENNAIVLTDDMRLRKKSDEAGVINVNTPELLIRYFDED